MINDIIALAQIQNLHKKHDQFSAHVQDFHEAQNEFNILLDHFKVLVLVNVFMIFISMSANIVLVVRLLHKL